MRNHYLNILLLLFTCTVGSDPSRPHGPQHARPASCPPLFPGVCLSFRQAAVSIILLPEASADMIPLAVLETRGTIFRLPKQDFPQMQTFKMAPMQAAKKKLWPPETWDTLKGNKIRFVFETVRGMIASFLTHISVTRKAPSSLLRQTKPENSLLVPHRVGCIIHTVSQGKQSCDALRNLKTSSTDSH